MAAVQDRDVVGEEEVPENPQVAPQIHRFYVDAIRRLRRMPVYSGVSRLILTTLFIALIQSEWNGILFNSLESVIDLPVNHEPPYCASHDNPYGLPAGAFLPGWNDDPPLILGAGPAQQVPLPPSPDHEEYDPAHQFDSDSGSESGSDSGAHSDTGGTSPSRSESGSSSSSSDTDKGGEPPSKKHKGEFHSQSHSSRSHTVVNGNFTSDPGKFPFVVAIGSVMWPRNVMYTLPHPWAVIRRVPRTICTGSLIHPQYVLTAAHCIRHAWSSYYVTAGTACRPEYGGIFSQKAEMRRVIGTMTRSDAPVNWDIISGMEHLPVTYPERYKAGLPHHGENWAKEDIALLRLDRPFKLSDHIKLIRLPTHQDCYSVYSRPWTQVKPFRKDQLRLTAIGWGAGRHFEGESPFDEISTWLGWLNVPHPGTDEDNFPNFWDEDHGQQHRAEMVKNPLLPVKDQHLTLARKAFNSDRWYPHADPEARKKALADTWARPLGERNYNMYIVPRSKPIADSPTLAQGDSGGPWVKRVIVERHEKTRKKSRKWSFKPLQVAVTQSGLHGEGVPANVGAALTYNGVRLCWDNMVWLASTGKLPEDGELPSWLREWRRHLQLLNRAKVDNEGRATAAREASVAEVVAAAVEAVAQQEEEEQKQQQKDSSHPDPHLHD